MAGAAGARPSRRRTKAAAAAEPAPQQQQQQPENLPAFNFATREFNLTPLTVERRSSRTVASSKEKAFAVKEKAKSVPSPAAKKNLQRLFDESSEQHKRIKGWKILLLLVAVIGIASFCGLRDGHTRFPDVPAAGKASEVEDYMWKTSRWLQVQLDLVDEKIGKEVYGVRTELEEKVNRKTQGLESEIRRMKAQVDNVDNTLKMLYSDDLLSKGETVELITTVLEERAREGSDRVITLDDVRVAARKFVLAELEIHAADGIGRVDYAVESGGGKVVHHSDGYFQGLHWTQLGIHVVPGAFRRHPMAERVLKPSFGEPGQCLPLKGSNVTVDIRLRTHIHPEAVTLEHLSKRVSYDMRTAPKDFRIYGWSDRNSLNKFFDSSNSTLLGEFTYDIDKGSAQTFNIPKSISLTAPVNMIRLHVLSNYGNPTYTCLYRLRVHGSEGSVQ